MSAKPSNWGEFFWGPSMRSSYLFIAAAVLLLSMLGGRELWTQEHRWADIVSGMFFRRDFLHPYLGTNDYYDKPLLSYWLIAAVSALTRQLNTWVLRLPSALAGLLAVWSITRLGQYLHNKHFGLLCGWLLLTTFFFVFWARVSSADMLNLAGSLLAVTWYFEKREETGLVNYAVFFTILALTSLCKGLVGAVVPVLAIIPDLLHQQRFKQHLNPRLFLGLIPAVLVYIFPFWASAHFGNTGYGQNGLYLAYRENVMRYFQPFDHKDPIYTYFLYLPIYLLPWTLFFIPALFSLRARWSNLSWNSKWMVWSTLILFVFFSASGSRRSYYILPMLPFAILMTADWLQQWSQADLKRRRLAGKLIGSVFMLFVLCFTVLQPWYYSNGGNCVFAAQLRAEATKIKPWEAWEFVLLDPESKITFYLQLPPEVKYLDVKGDRNQQTLLSLLQTWPLMKTQNKNIIYISRLRYASWVQQMLPDYQCLVAPRTRGERLFKIKNANAAVAFIPFST